MRQTIFNDAIQVGVPNAAILDVLKSLKGLALAKAATGRRVEIAEAVLSSFHANQEAMTLLESIAKVLNGAEDYNGRKPVDPKEIIIYKIENDSFVIPAMIKEYAESFDSPEELYSLKEDIRPIFKKVKEDVISQFKSLATEETPGLGLFQSVPEGTSHTVNKDGTAKVTVELSL